jgi:hypothetical protein
MLFEHPGRVQAGTRPLPQAQTGKDEGERRGGGRAAALGSSSEGGEGAVRGTQRCGWGEQVVSQVGRQMNTR